MPYDPFETQAPGSDYAARITQVVFAANDYGFQATFTMQYREPFVNDEGQLKADRPEFIGIGPNSVWEAKDGGTRFTNPHTDEPKLRQNSHLGRILDRVKELLPGEVLRSSGASPFEEKFWLSLPMMSWHTEGAGADYSFTDKESGEKKSGKTKGYIMPYEVVGAAASNGSAGPGFSLEALALPPDVQQKVEEIANVSATLQQFQATIMPYVYSDDFPAPQRDAMAKAAAEDAGWQACRTLI